MEKMTTHETEGKNTPVKIISTRDILWQSYTRKIQDSTFEATFTAMRNKKKVTEPCEKV